jgi:hypothetical protein
MDEHPKAAPTRTGRPSSRTDCPAPSGGVSGQRGEVQFDLTGRYALPPVSPSDARREHWDSQHPPVTGEDTLAGGEHDALTPAVAPLPGSGVWLSARCAKGHVSRRYQRRERALSQG